MKLILSMIIMRISCRSRKGAWIEIRAFRSFNKIKESRSRKGAWIEISALQASVSKQNGRSRKGAWIEIGVTNWYDPAPRSLP